ncbi:MAG TPA: type II and III secretion system protein family protein [Phycisphaerae bacterium]|nr:type II and III secretion system protein family protein [Phycisphaerae bacterium]
MSSKRVIAVIVALTGTVALVVSGPGLAGNGAAKPAGEKEQVLTVFLGRSQVVTAPWKTIRVSVTDPAIADVKVLTPTQVLLQAKAIGSTDLILWSQDEQVWRARVDVTADVQALQQQIQNEMFPDAKVKVTQAGNVLLITGSFANAEQAAQLRRFLDASELKYVDMTRVAGVQQVMLKVRIAEVSRVALRLLGINALHTNKDFFGASTIGSSSGGAINPISIGVADGTVAGQNLPFTFTSDTTVSSSVTLFAGFPKIDMEVFLQALAENQYLRVLAEPNLVALSGQEASFLAGGEYPIPIVQGSTTGGGSSISVEYREFGVRLQFRPTVLGENGIRLFVAPEVSELSDVGAVEIEGFRIPSVVTRKAATTLELKSGQSFAMAGLIRRSTNARTSRVPGLGDLPILGALFRSVRYELGETELIVLVTAELVEPLDMDIREKPVPGDFHIEPNDWELYAFGKIEGDIKAHLKTDPPAWIAQHRLQRLKGPGAWVRYTQPRAYSRAGEPNPSKLPPTPGNKTAPQQPAAAPAGK